MSLLLALATSFGIVVAMLGISALRVAPSPVGRLNRFTDKVKTLEELELEQPFSERVIRPALGQIARLIGRFLPARRDQSEGDLSLGRFQKRLLLAGTPHNLTESDFLGILAMSTLGTGGLVCLLMGLAGSDFASSAMLGGVGMALGFIAPNFWLSTRIARRRKQILRALPDSIDLLAINLKSGIGFDAALARQAEKAENALTQEYRRVLVEMQLGRVRREALKDLVVRTSVPDLSNFVAAIVQADQLGVSISKVIEAQAEQIRTLRKQRAEEQAAKAPLKMLFPMVLLIFPALFIVIMGPAVPKLFGGGGPF